jgi:hypothetical protein
LWTLDSIGILSEKTVYVKKLVLIPNAANDEIIFRTWDENAADKVAAGTKKFKTGTITSGTTLTSTGNLTSAVADGMIFHILSSTGAAANVGREVVTTAGNNNAVVCASAGWTNEATKVYSWTTYTTSVCMKLKAGATDASPTQLDFTDNPLKFTNLALDSITSSAVAQLYISQYGK